MDHSTLIKSNYANIWELPKKQKNTILQAKIQIISLYLDLIDSNLNEYALSCCYFIFTYLKIIRD